ncbi:hypothetical protein C8R48DRAFT_678916 [Suillus tomentosus]|nr:hypothetical protein C8R48DRAFT_678916 [Suillus tomentosus]
MVAVGVVSMVGRGGIAVGGRAFARPPTWHIGRDLHIEGCSSITYVELAFNPSGGHAAGLSHLYDIADAIGSMKIDDTEDLEANLVMELARARREKLRAEKSLADCVVRELELMASLSKFKSSLSEQKLDRADVGLGYMRIAFKTHGLSHRAHHLHGSVVEVGDHDGHEITIQLD